MADNISLDFEDVKKGDKSYQWVNVNLGKARIGKARILVKNSYITIHSINIYEEYERHGYARAVIDYFKKRTPELIAENVRYKARGFWSHVDFFDNHDGNYRWKRSSGS